MPTNFQDIFETTQQQLRLRKPQELVTVKSHGGYEMQLQDVPDGEAFKLVKKFIKELICIIM